MVKLKLRTLGSARVVRTLPGVCVCVCVSHSIDLLILKLAVLAVGIGHQTWRTEGKVRLIVTIK